MHRLVIVTPALAAANNGNWQTAQRWARMLRSDYRVRLVAHWDGPADDALMIALHARRSAASIAAWRRAHPARPLAVVLTGTDLYADIAHDVQAHASLALADRLVVLQPLGRLALPVAMQGKVEVIVQSSPGQPALPKTTRHLRALMVGHLRSEKAPETYWAAARRLRERRDVRLDHIGGALDPALADAARACMAQCPRYRWLGALPHAQTLARIRRAHLLVHPSRLEGGAHVVIEAITRGTPVLASRIAGNLGLLGEDYEGGFDFGDDAQLATLLQRCRDESAMLARLQAQCALRAPRFAPDQERADLRALVRRLLENAR